MQFKLDCRHAGERELISRLINENTLKRPRSVRENVDRRMRRNVTGCAPRHAAMNNSLHPFRTRHKTSEAEDARAYISGSIVANPQL